MIKPYTPDKYQKEKLKYVKILIKKETHMRLKVNSAKSRKSIVSLVDELSRVKI